MKRIYYLYFDNPTAEESAAREWLQRQFPQLAFPLAWAGLLQKEPPFQPGDIIWWHRDRPQRWQQSELEKLRVLLLNFFAQGGSVLFSLLAVDIPAQIGLESSAPNQIYDTTWQEKTGEHQIRGFIGNSHHPIFVPFHGGVFTWRPQIGERFTGRVYTNNRRPQQAAILGVERFHIGLDEQTVTAWEYQVENGISLCFGSTTYFAMQDRIFLPHLEELFKSCFSYLQTGKPARLKKNYFQPKGTDIFHTSEIDFHTPMPWLELAALESREHFEIDKPGKNFWDLAGRRALVVGKECGGLSEIWFHPFRGFKEISCSVQSETGEIHQLTDASHITIFPDRVVRTFRFANFEIEEQILSSLTEPVVIVQYHCNSPSQMQLRLQVHSDFRLMWPYRAGILGEIGVQVLNRSVFLLDSARNFLSAILVNTDLSLIQEEDCSDDHYSEIGLVIGLTLSGTQPVQLLFYGSDQGVENNLSHLHELLAELPKQFQKLQQHLQAIAAAGGEVITPDEEVNQALRWAKWKLDAFVADLPELGKSLLAGYSTTLPDWFTGRPGYAWYFGRDSVWCALAFLDLGETETVRAVLQHLIRFQEFTGKIYHEVSTSGVVHYDAADSTPLFLLLIGEYYHHTGDSDFIRRNWQAIDRAYRFCLSTDRDGDGFIENTDVGHGWIEGGKLYGAHVTHYLAGIWVRALQLLCELAEIVDLPTDWDAEDCTRRMKRTEADFQARFWQVELGYLGYGLDRQGQLLTPLTIMPTVAILLGVVEWHKADSTLSKLDTAEFCCDWGVRMVSDRHPDFNPTGYHSGSVWPLFTGWMSLADYQVGRSLPAWLHWQHQIPLNRDIARGCMPEVLRGDTYEYAGICQHQAWSEAMVLLPFYRGLLGLKSHLPNNRLEMTPQIPEIWPQLTVRNLCLGDRSIQFNFQRIGGLFRFRWELAKGEPFTIDFKVPFPATAQIAMVHFDGQLVSPQICQGLNNKILQSDFILESAREISIEFLHFLRFFPQAYQPRLGQPSFGYMVVDETFHAGNYRILLHGRSGADYKGRILAIGVKKIWTVNAILLETEESEWLEVHFIMPPADEPYQFFEMKIEYEI